MSETRKDWRTMNVMRNRKYEGLVERLCTRKSVFSKRPIFEYNKDLMVFAAIVGYSKLKEEDLLPNPIQITLGTYATDDKDGFIYLLALLNTREPHCLKDENLDASVKIFEKYCNGGLSLIEQWLNDKPADIEGVDTLIERIFDELVSHKPSDNVTRAGVEF